MIFVILLPLISNFLPQKQTGQLDPKLMEAYINSQKETYDEDDEKIEKPDIEGIYQVIDIPSGNTITVMWGDEKKDIKLIGIKEISTTKEVLKKKIENDFIQLEFDDCYPKEDSKGSLFAYAYLSDGTFINYDLLLHGNAKIKSNLSENIKYIADLSDAQNSAKANQYGCWAKISEREEVKK